MVGLAPWFYLVTAGFWQVAPTATPTQLNTQVVSESTDAIEVEFQIPGFQTSTVMIGDQGFVLPEVTGARPLARAGLPALPVIGRDVEIPSTGDFQAEVVEVDSVRVPLGPIAPSKGDLERSVNPELVPYSFAPEVYSQGAIYPGSILGAQSTFLVRGRRGLHLEIHPMQYDAADGQTLVHSRIKVRIARTQAKLGMNEALRPALVEDALQPAIDSLFLNRKTIKEGLPSPQATPRIAFVVADEFREAINPLVLSKQQKGYQTWVVSPSVVGRTAEAIKQHLQGLYDRERINYIVLVGDAEFVPYMKGTAGNVMGNEADPMYGLLEGNDSYPDAIVGRLSAKKPEEVEIQVNRILRYEEQSEEMLDWRSHHMGIASNEGEPTDKARMDILKGVLAKGGYSQFTDVYDPGAKAKDITQALEKGVGYIDYIGHGTKDYWVTSGFSTKNINELGNNKWPFIVSVACVNGDFGTGPDAFAERWLKAGTPEAPAGAIAIFASSTNQSWVPPTVGQRRIADLVVSGERSTIGELFFSGSLAVLQDNSDTAVQTFQSWHIFGDPTVSIVRPNSGALP